MPQWHIDALLLKRGRTSSDFRLYFAAGIWMNGMAQPIMYVGIWPFYF
jgi:hypothetical protein